MITNQVKYSTVTARSLSDIDVLVQCAKEISKIESLVPTMRETVTDGLTYTECRSVRFYDLYLGLTFWTAVSVNVNGLAVPAC